jgi:type IV secretory pathway TraG/TraD family ATPase VirD4
MPAQYSFIHGDAATLIAILALVAATVARVWRRGSTERYKRGAIVREAMSRGKMSAREGLESYGLLALAGVRVRAEDEVRHFKIIGMTGTGKSTAIRELLAAALQRGDRAVVADPDGAYRARLFNRYRGDVVLNPFDEDSLRWDPFAEIADSYDAEHLAAALIASRGDASAAEWCAYGRTFLSALLRSGRLAGRTDCAELWRLLSVASPEELRPILSGTAARSFLDPENARMFGSIRSVTVSAVAAIEHVSTQRAPPFSVREWVRSRTAPGSLFIPYKARHIAALRSMVATWMRIAIFEALNADEGSDQRLWFVVDELDALGAIDGLKDALARLRKFGGRCVLGFQSIGQVSNIYGGDAQAIIENCCNSLILRCSASENGGTSHFASRLIGDREIVRKQVSRGSDHGSTLLSRDNRRSRSIGEQHVTEAAVLPSQIEQLPDFCGYLKVASSREWIKVCFGRSR